MYANLLEKCPGVTILSVTQLVMTESALYFDPSQGGGVLVEVIPIDSQKLVDAFGPENAKIHSASYGSVQIHVNANCEVGEADILHINKLCPKPCPLCENKKRADEWYRRFHDEN